MNIPRMPGQVGGAWGLAGVLAAAVLGMSAPRATAQAKGFTIEQALSAPYTSDLRAAPSGGRLAWAANIDGRRNLWVAEPAPDGKSYRSRQITHYADDDGQEIHSAQWTADAASIVYVRGDSATGENHPVPNPAGFPKGAQQQLWVVSAEGGEPRLLGEGRAPAVSPDASGWPTRSKVKFGCFASTIATPSPSNCCKREARPRICAGLPMARA
ncbi:MAG: hypothetical protein ABSD75_06965 [Terriglobales bacterium]